MLHKAPNAQTEHTPLKPQCARAHGSQPAKLATIYTLLCKCLLCTCKEMINKNTTGCSKQKPKFLVTLLCFFLKQYSQVQYAELQSFKRKWFKFYSAPSTVQRDSAFLETLTVTVAFFWCKTQEPSLCVCFWGGFVCEKSITYVVFFFTYYTTFITFLERYCLNACLDQTRTAPGTGVNISEYTWAPR